MYDAIVVGARVAGATTAMLLARAGHRVLLLDRARFPSDTMSTHYVHQPTIARLNRWGVLDELKATGCPPMEVARWSLNGVELTGCSPAVDGIRAAYGPRRFVLDTLLVEAAGRAGAKVREGCRVSELIWDGDTVAGVRGHADGVGVFEERAKLVIGADGINSVVAEAVGAATYDEVPTLSCLYYTYWAGVPADYEVFVDQRRAIGVVPTNDGLTMIGIQWPREEFATVRRDIEGSYLAVIDRIAPPLAERVRAGSRAAGFVGTGRLPNFFREASGPGWALVGDAGYHKDPVGAYGITDAIKHADLLAATVAPALGGDVPLTAALAAYAEERDRDSAPFYQFNLEAAKFDPMPEMLTILRAIQHDQGEVDRFFGVISGAVPFAEFFTDELIARAAA